MLFSSPVYSQASGSIAGITYSHNRGGMYARARATPTDPATAPQVEVRSLMNFLSNRWVNELTQAERDAWETYAANVQVPNALGAQIFISGLNHYVRSNLPRLQAGLPDLDEAPTTFDLGTLSQVGIDSAAGPNQIDVTFDNTDDWATGVGGALLVYASRGQNPSINFFKGPFCFAEAILGAVVAPTSPATITSVFADYATGQRVWIKVRATQDDARLSPAFVIGPVVVT
jgi:hypothetical protein